MITLLALLFLGMVFTFAVPAATASTQSGSETAYFGGDSDTLWFLIRVDDIYFRSASYQNMSVPHNFTDFQSAVEEFGAKVTWGVIPHRLIEPLNGSLAPK